MASPDTISIRLHLTGIKVIEVIEDAAERLVVAVALTRSSCQWPVISPRFWPLKSPHSLCLITWASARSVPSFEPSSSGTIRPRSHQQRRGARAGREVTPRSPARGGTFHGVGTFRCNVAQALPLQGGQATTCRHLLFAYEYRARIIVT